jgi:hypothetical protein
MPKERNSAEGKAKEPPYKEIARFAKEKGFRVTSTTGGEHNKNSAHYDKRAVDVSVKNKTDKQVTAFEKAARAAGIRVRDERTRPPGQKVWSGPHIHLEVPRKKGK